MQARQGWPRATKRWIITITHKRARGGSSLNTERWSMESWGITPDEVCMERRQHRAFRRVKYDDAVLWVYRWSRKQQHCTFKWWDILQLPAFHVSPRLSCHLYQWVYFCLHLSKWNTTPTPTPHPRYPYYIPSGAVHIVLPFSTFFLFCFSVRLHISRGHVCYTQTISALILLSRHNKQCITSPDGG